MANFQKQTAIKYRKTGTLNAHSLNTGRFSELIVTEKSCDIDIIALQEICWPGEHELFSKDNCTIYYGVAKSRTLGIGFLINKRISQAIIDMQIINEQFSYVVLMGNFCKQVLINMHCSTEDKDKDSKHLFYETIEQVFDKFSAIDAKIVLEDFNAKIEKKTIYMLTVGTESLHDVSNDNGTRVIGFAALKNFVVKSTYFKHTNIHKASWISPDGTTHNKIDLS